MNFDLTKALVRTLLENPHTMNWTTQGFGFMRAYPQSDKRFRINVWHSSLRVPGVSTIHDHPWDFTSLVVAGRLSNRRYDVGMGTPFNYMLIRPGEHGGPLEEPKQTWLFPHPTERYYPGEVYRQRKDEVHETEYLDGTVTINDRTNRGADEARVFWLTGDWVDATPRPAYTEEIERITLAALARMR